MASALVGVGRGRRGGRTAPRQPLCQAGGHQALHLVIAREWSCRTAGYPRHPHHPRLAARAVPIALPIALPIAPRRAKLAVRTTPCGALFYVHTRRLLLRCPLCHRLLLHLHLRPHVRLRPNVCLVVAAVLLIVLAFAQEDHLLLLLRRRRRLRLLRLRLRLLRLLLLLRRRLPFPPLLLFGCRCYQLRRHCLCQRRLALRRCSRLDLYRPLRRCSTRGRRRRARVQRWRREGLPLARRAVEEGQARRTAVAGGEEGRLWRGGPWRGRRREEL